MTRASYEHKYCGSKTFKTLISRSFQYLGKQRWMKSELCSQDVMPLFAQSPKKRRDVVEILCKQTPALTFRSRVWTAGAGTIDGFC